MFTNENPYYTNLRFRVDFLPFGLEMDGIWVAGFSEVSGLAVETELEEYQEGGVNHFVHKLPKRSKFPNLVFKRGFVRSNELWRWYEDFHFGPPEKRKRKQGAIILMDANGNDVGAWAFEGAYPVKWVGPEFRATHGEVAVETLEIVHHGLKSYF